MTPKEPFDKRPQEDACAAAEHMKHQGVSKITVITV